MLAVRSLCRFCPYALCILLRRHASVVQSVLLLVPDTHALATHPTVGGRLVQFDCDLLAV